MITTSTAKSLIGATVLAASVSALGHVPDILARQTGAMDDGSTPELPELTEECQKAIAGLLPIYSGLPQIPSFILTEAASLETAMAAPEDFDPCATPDFKGDDLSQWNSYTSAALEWYSSNSETINQALSSCTELNQYTQAVAVCTNKDTEASKEGGSETATATTSATNTGTDTADATESTAADDNMTDHMGMTMDMSMTHGGSQPTGDAGSSPTPAAAPRESGILVAAAVAVAGVLGLIL